MATPASLSGALAQVVSNYAPGDNSAGTGASSKRKGSFSESPRLRPKTGSCKPMEARRVGGTAWQTLPSLKKAAEETGIEERLVKRLCDEECEGFGWEFRWPLDHFVATLAEVGPQDLATVNFVALAERLKEAPPEERRGLLAALPEATRRAFSQHLRTAAQMAQERKPLSVDEAARRRQQEVLSRLPAVVLRAEGGEKHALLEALEGLNRRIAAILAAPDIAAVAALVREVPRQQRRPLLMAIPEETQQALQRHLLASGRSPLVSPAPGPSRPRCDSADSDLLVLPPAMNEGEEPIVAMVH